MRMPNKRAKATRRTGVDHKAVARRLSEVAGELSLREVGALTAMNFETT